MTTEPARLASFACTGFPSLQESLGERCTTPEHVVGRFDRIVGNRLDEHSAASSPDHQPLVVKTARPALPRPIAGNPPPLALHCRL